MPTRDSPAVLVEGLRIRYGRHDAVDGLDLRVEAGSITALIGPNGAGKTSTVECCEGYRRPSAGTVRVLGLDPHRDGARLRHRVGVMLQEGAGMHQAVECAAMLEHVARLYADPRDPRALLAELGLDGVARTTVRRLSGGERQRLALACALVGRPELLFADEPTAGLDPRARQACWAMLEEVRAAGTTIVLTTHQIDDVERVADDVVIIDRGRAVAHGSPAQLTGGRASVSFSARPGLDLQALRAALPVAVDAGEPAPGRYHVSATDIGPAVLATVTSWCANQGEMPRDLQVGRRSLESVFLEITGRELTE